MNAYVCAKQPLLEIKNPVIADIAQRCIRLIKERSHIDADDNFTDIVLNEEFDNRVVWHKITYFKIEDLINQYVEQPLSSRDDLGSLSDSDKEEMASDLCDKLKQIYFFFPF